MQNIIIAIQIIISILLIIFVLIQNKGTGLGRVWGGSSVSFSRRGLEKALFKFTFITVGLFIIISILQTTL